MSLLGMCLEKGFSDIDWELANAVNGFVWEHTGDNIFSEEFSPGDLLGHVLAIGVAWMLAKIFYFRDAWIYYNEGTLEPIEQPKLTDGDDEEEFTLEQQEAEVEQLVEGYRKGTNGPF
jgi:hypothetical protein